MGLQRDYSRQNNAPPLQEVYLLVPRPYEYVALYSKREVRLLHAAESALTPDDPMNG